MPTTIRIATFNVENWDDAPPSKPSEPTFEERLALMRPQLERISADILCLQEVHGQGDNPTTLRALDTLLSGTRYESYNRASTLTTAGDPYKLRNLVILSRFSITSREQFKNKYADAPFYGNITGSSHDSRAIEWERPILYVTIDVGGKTFHIFNLHMKSKEPTRIEGEYPKSQQEPFAWRSAAGWAEGAFLSGIKRLGQALEVRIRIDQLFEAAENAQESAFIALCGDLNADHDEPPLEAIRGDVEDNNNPALAGRVMVPCERTVPEPSRFSLYHHGRKNMLDHVLVSRPLLQFYKNTEIHNELIHDESQAFRTDKLFPESDHAPVIAEFLIPD